MNLDRILTEIDVEISRLQQAKQILSQDSSSLPVVKRGPGRPPASASLNSLKPAEANGAGPKRRTMSAAGRARIAAAQKARWAKAKKAAKTALAAKPAKKSAVKTAPKKVGRPAVKKAITAKSETASASS